MANARRYVLDRGLIDWVELERIDWAVRQDYPEAQLSEVQRHTLELIESLVHDGPFEIGDLSGEGGRFVKWEMSLDGSLRRIYDMYVTDHQNENVWPWACWLSITRQGLRVALGVEGVGPAREDVLLAGLEGSIPLEYIHRWVMEDNPQESLPRVRSETLLLVRSLVADGLAEVGDYSDKSKGFNCWRTTIDESMARIEQLYVAGFDDPQRWTREVWLKLTPDGVRAAHATRRAK